MNLRILQFVGFLIGLFLTLSYFSMINNYTFKNTIKNIEKFNNTSNLTSMPSSSSSLSSNISSSNVNLLPRSKDKFIILSTFNNITLANNEQKWYDNDINFQNFALTGYNNGSYFSFNNPIELTGSKIINGINGANINKIQLTGPSALYFANNYTNHNYDLSSFTIIFMLSIKNITNNVMLFEMLANTSVIDVKNEDPIYLANSVSIYLILRKNKNFDIELTIANKKYIISDIDNKLLLGTDINLISLVFDGVNITFIINNNTYNIKYTNKQPIKLGSSEIIINRDGDLNGILYSFVYYKGALTMDEIVSYKKYNFSYIYGVNYVYELNNKTSELLVEATNRATEKDKHIASLLEQLNNCSNNNSLLINGSLLSNLNNVGNLFPRLPTSL
jgi:hypothetical protein